MKNIVFSWFILPVRNAVMLREFLDEEIVLGVLFTAGLVMLTENLIFVPCSDHTWEDDHAAKMFHHPHFQDMGLMRFSFLCHVVYCVRGP